MGSPSVHFNLITCHCRFTIPIHRFLVVLGRTLNPFTWHRKEIELSPHIRTFNTIKSLAGGVAAVLELIETDELNEADCSCYGRVLSKH